MKQRAPSTLNKMLDFSVSAATNIWMNNTHKLCRDSSLESRFTLTELIIVLVRLREFIVQASSLRLKVR